MGRKIVILAAGMTTICQSAEFKLFKLTEGLTLSDDDWKIIREFNVSEDGQFDDESEMIYRVSCDSTGSRKLNFSQCYVTVNGTPFNPKNPQKLHTTNGWLPFRDLVKQLHAANKLEPNLRRR